MTTGRDGGAAIAVVGASVLYPGSIGAQAFWRNILDGRDFMTDVPADNWLIEDFYDPDPSKPGKIYVRRGAFLPKIDFDPLAHGLPPNQLSTTDTAQLLALIVADKVLDDAASVQFGKVDKRNISVILGVASATELVGQMAARIQRPHWIKALREMGLPEGQVQEACDRIEATYPAWDESTFPGLLGNVVAGRIANRLDLGGANCVVDAACASSLGAVAMAAQELQLGHSDLVITGGVDALNDAFMFMCFSKTPALSPTGDCRPFSEDADGTMLGEGIGMIALRRLKDAERDNDRIYAVLRGIGSSSDGRAKSIYAPHSEGQETAIRRAYERADYGPEAVTLVEAHGTATKAGDLAEFVGLRRAFAPLAKRQSIALGSVKSQIGHTKAAAGAASLFKAVMALHHKVLPPTLKVDRPNRKLEIETSPFYLNTETRPWVQSPGVTRKAGVSSFGFGGSNFHVTLEEYVGTASSALRTSSSRVHLLLLGAPDAASLIVSAREASLALASRPLPTLARETQLAFAQEARHRLALLVADIEGARTALSVAAEQIGRAPQQGFSYPNRMHYGLGSGPPKTAFLFPGQGSQYLNMGRDLAVEFDSARAVWDESAAISFDPEFGLHEVVFPIPMFAANNRAAQTERLTQTEWAQPAIGAMSLALLRVLEQAGVRPDVVAGHSYGEVMALHAAGSIPAAADMLAISRRRGELMAAAGVGAAAGAMMALRASEAEAVALLRAHRTSGVCIANINSPQQVVVAGERPAVEALQSKLQAAGTPCTLLPVSTAFHTALVADSARPFAEFLAEYEFAAPLLPVYGNTCAELYTVDVAQIPGMLGRQLAMPVRFADMISRMYGDGVRLFVEVGPGATLTGMVEDCLAGRQHLAVATDHRKMDGRAALFNALGAISASGAAVDYAGLWAPFAPFESAGDSPRSTATVRLGGANYGKPYPAGGTAARPGPNPERPAPSIEAVVRPAASPQGFIPATPALLAAGAPSVEAWTVFQSLQQNLLEAQKVFTQTLAASHEQFLRTSEASLFQLGVPANAPVPLYAAAPPSEPSVSSVPVTPSMTQLEQPLAEPQPVISTSPSIRKLILDVVAETTGYPAEMLGMDLDLEADLGIDFTKRTQILSALQERLPELTSVDANALSSLRSLGEIVAFTQATAPAGSDECAAPDRLPSSTAPERDIAALLLATVAEKTGYPVEMLNLDMELEGGLGIDSIKRVQILSAMQQQLPALASVDANVLASLGTLGEIVALARQGRATDPAVQASEGAASPALALETLAVALADVAAPGLITPGLIGRETVWVAGGPADVAKALVCALTEFGVTASAVQTAPSNATAVIVLTGLEPADGEAAHLALNERAFLQLKACADSMAEGGRLLVTVQSTGGDFGLSGVVPQAWSSGIAGAAKTAALEWPHVSVKAIDIAQDDPRAMAERLAAELILGGEQLEVALGPDGRRATLVASPIATTRQDPATLPSDGVILVSGGARGITAACLEALLRRQPARVAILGRTQLDSEPEGLAGLHTEAALHRALLERASTAGRSLTPQTLAAEVRKILAGRELKANLARLEATGAQVRYFAVDVTDEAAVRTCTAEIRKNFGPIRALVHAAGVLADKEIRRKTLDQFRQVMTTKAAGLMTLLKATREDDLTRIFCFSSVAAWRGNVGQSDYAMANTVLNRVCCAEQTLRGPGCRAQAIGWGPWAGGMVDGGLKNHFESLGVGLIPLDAGAAFFAHAFETASGPTEVLFGSGLTAFGGRHQADARIFEARFHKRTHPYIASHVIRGRPVVPLTAAHDLAVHTVGQWLAGTWRPSRAAVEVGEGMVLDAYEDSGNVFRIECRRLGTGDRARVRILTADGALAYRFEVDLEPGSDVADPPLPSNLTPWPLDKPVYDGRLFHGEALQVIERVEGLSDDGARAMLRSRSVVPFGAVAPIDLLDGGLQLAALWCHERLGQTSLPTAVGALRVQRPWPHGETVQCDAVCRAGRPLQIEWTLSFRDQAGGLLAVIEGLQFHLLPAPGALRVAVDLAAEA